MNSVAVLGYVAATCTTFAFVPQVVHVWRTRSTRDISLTTFVVMTAGVLLWLAYGAIIHNLPLVIANGTTSVLCMVILAFKLRQGR